MAFVYEMILEDDQFDLMNICKERSVKYVLRSEVPQFNQMFKEKLKRRHLPSQWVVDRERDAFMTGYSTCIDHDDRLAPGAYVLGWKEEAILFNAHENWRGYSHSHTIFYTVYESTIRIPAHLESSRQEILALLKDALSAYHEEKERSNVDEVVVDIRQVAGRDQQRQDYLQVLERLHQIQKEYPRPPGK